LSFRRFVVDALQVRRLPAQAGTVVDDFAINLARSEIDETQKGSSAIGCSAPNAAGTPGKGMSEYHAGQQKADKFL
jgi:hypothetical protein